MTADNQPPRSTRRRVLATSSIALTALSTGCLSVFDTTQEQNGPSNVGLIGYPRGGRELPGGTPMADLPALDGEITVYSGRAEWLVSNLLTYIDELYPEFTIQPRYGSSTGLVNQILEEGPNSPADVFYSVNAGSLGVLANEDRTIALPTSIRSLVRDEFQTDTWVGTSGRARSVPFNTDTLTRTEIPDDIFAFAEPSFENQLAWAPTYGSCQAFITAMRLLNGEDATRDWVERMVAKNIQSYLNEFQVCRAIADGEAAAGFTNHYYIQRLLDGRPDAPIQTAFTAGDAGSMFNVAGATVIDTAPDQSLAQNFIRHLLSAEAQDYFARTTFEYPLIPEVDPIGDLPPIDELNPPADLDLTQLSDLEPTVDLMREAGAGI